MTENNLENRVNHLETKFEVFMQEMHDFKEEMRDFRKEMRDRDNRRAAEIDELRQKQEADMKEIRQKQESDMKEIRTTIDSINTKIDGIGKHFRNLTVAAVVGIGAITVSVVGFVITMATK